jgi:polyhydroxyalkanoate synthesis repressor PhaR
MVRTKTVGVRRSPMARVIKRYGNRKLYDTETSRYITLDRIAEMVRGGDDLRIVDNRTGEDLTALTFAQIIFEEQKRKNALLDLPVLRWIIQRGGAAVQELVTSVDRGREALESVRELAEKRVKQLVDVAERRHPEPHTHQGELRGADTPGADDSPLGRRLLTEILGMPQRQLEQLQQRIDAQVRASLERVTAHPAVQHELRRIEESIRGLEQQLSKLRRDEPRRAPRRSPKRRGVRKHTAN